MHFGCDLEVLFQFNIFCVVYMVEEGGFARCTNVGAREQKTKLQKIASMLLGLECQQRKLECLKHEAKVAYQKDAIIPSEYEEPDPDMSKF